MMVMFFFGMGASALLVATTQGPWTMAAALTLMGAFSSIYHPVGIPMLVQGAPNPGRTIGFNGLVGNLGIAIAALVTGFLVKFVGWRMAFALPGLVSLAAGWLLARGKPQAALHTLIYGVWVIITLVAVINGGIRVPLVYAYPLVILTTGWMVSSRAAIIVTLD